MLKSELEIISNLKSLFSPRSSIIGIGDDAAVLENNQIISVDAVVEGIHFLRNEALWQDVAYKLFTSNASDMAAMGGYPTAYALTLSLPEYWENSDLECFLSGIKDFLSLYPAEIIGGDTVRSKEFFASVTVFGQLYRDTPLLRSQARVGDFIYCTGTIGDSRIGLNQILHQNILPLDNTDYFKKRHYRPTPRMNYIKELQKHINIHACMDISDGLIEDLQKLCIASNVSFYIDAELLPIAVNEIGISNYQLYKYEYQREALISGEDYELLFTSPDMLDTGYFDNIGIKATCIGRIHCLEEKNRILWNHEIQDSLNFQGYRH